MNTLLSYLVILISCLLLTCRETPVPPVGPPISGDSEEPETSPQQTRDEFDGTYTLFFQPDNGDVGDPMPFYDPKSRDFKIMYLQNDIPNRQRGVFHPIWAVKTSDLAHYDFMKELIPCGAVGSQDAAIGTGSTVYNPDDELYYNFYTGNKLNPAANENGQVVMVATSNDYIHWYKRPGFIIKGNEYGYDRNDFRDPDVFRTEDGIWHMLVATLNNKREGVVAEFVSTDLQKWTSAGVFMNMHGDRFYECPDVFEMNGWWYMIYSEKHVDVRRVLYFKGRTLDEIKMQTSDRNKPRDEKAYFLDSRGFYAGKTASDGKERYIWGWNPSRPRHDNKNVGIPPREPRWGGNLVAHRLIQHEDGSLTLGEIPQVANRFESAVPKGPYTVTAAEPIVFDPLGTSNHLSFTIKTASPEASFGISFCRTEEADKYYTIRVLPEEGGTFNIEFAEEGPLGTGTVKWIEGCPFTPPEDLKYNISIFNENSVMVLYINDNVCYTNRVYGIAENRWSICSYTSDMDVTDVAVSKMID